jgi:WD40 repeat protein/class 3 adenylate cyclase
LTPRMRHGLPTGTVTFLFTDIEGSTRLLHELGDEYADVVTAHRRIVRDVVEQHRGVEVDTQGDSFFIAFAEPTAAVEAASDIQAGLASHPWPGDAAVRVRMGLHTGEPLISDFHYFGVDVHRAARIAAAAHGGQVLVSEYAKKLVTGDGGAHIAFRDTGVHRLKDLPEPERLFQLVIEGLPSTFPPPRAHGDAIASAGLPDYSLPPADVPCPYKGLVPFEPEDNELFFGREELVDSIVGRLAQSSFLAVLGPSGSGKSSLVRAGVVPQLARRNGVASLAIISPGDDPLGGLSQTRGAELLFVDQLEEVFTLCTDEEERRSFIEAILGRANDGTRVVVALRADFYGHCAAYPELAAMLSDHQVLVGPMREEELRSAVERPAEHAGLLLEPGVVEGIVRDVIGEPGALPLLSHALLETWKRRSGTMLTLLGYLQSGGVEGAIAKTAESVYSDALTSEQQALARSIFLRLTEVGEGTEETRRRVSVHELTPRAEQADDVAEVLRRLVDARLIIVDEGTVEVAHEALIRHWPTLRTWLDEDREGRLIHRRLTEAAREWDALGGDSALLYRGMRLAGASEWAAAHDPELNELERGFLAASRAAELGEMEATRRRNRRLRVLVAALALLLSLAVVAGVVAFLQRQHARAAQTSAIAQRVGAQALVQKDLDRSLLLARQGVELDDTLATRGNLLAALVRSPAAIGVMRPLPGRLLGSAISPDGRVLAVSNNDRDTALIDTRTRRVVRTLKSDGVIFLKDGERFIDFQLAQESRRIVVRDVKTGKVLRVIRMHPGSSFWFSNDLSRIVVTEDGGAAVVRATSDDRVIERVPPGRGRSIWDVSMRDPNHLLTIEAPKSNPDCFAAGCVLVWHDLRTGRVVSSISVADFYSYGPSDDGTRLSVGRTDGSVSIYNLRTGARRDMQGRHNAAGANPWFSRDGKLLASGGDDRQVLVWDAASRDLVQTLTGHNGRVFGPSFSPDDRTLYTTSLDGSLMIWDLDGDRRLGRPIHAGTGNSLPSDPGPDGLLAVSPVGALFAVTQDDGKAAVFDSETFEQKEVIQTASGRLFDAAFSPDGRLLATAGVDGAVGIWNVATGKPVHERLPGPPRVLPEGPPNIALSVAVSSDGKTIAAGDTSGAIYIWDTESGKLLRAPIKTPIDPALPPPPPDASFPPTLGVMGLAFSPDGEKLVAGHDTNATVYSIHSGQPLYTVDVDGNYGHASAVAFSPDGSLLATGGGTGQVRFWDANTGAPNGRRVLANAGWVQSVAFDPSGRILVTSGTDGTTRLIDVAGRVILGTPLPGIDNVPEDAAFTPDGKRVIVMSIDGEGFAWDVTLAAWEKQACAIAGRNLTRDEWDEFLPDRPYEPACSPS